jgi:hypothetical protein
VRRCPGGLAESNELGRVVALVGANGDPPPVRPASSIASAASRSASPVARLTSPSTTSPCRFSIQRMAQVAQPGVDARVTVIDKGAAGSVSTEDLGKNPVVAFVFEQEGLMAGISLEGAKISKIEIWSRKTLPPPPLPSPQCGRVCDRGAQRDRLDCREPASRMPRTIMATDRRDIGWVGYSRSRMTS